MGWLRRERIVHYNVVLWTIAFGLPMSASAGWVIEQVEYANLGAEGTKILQYISKNRLKMVGDGHTFMMDFTKNLFIAADPERQVYWSGTVDTYLQEVKTFQQVVNNLTRTQMVEAMKDMPLDQRKAMEDLLQQMPNANASSPSVPVVKKPAVTIEHTAETATIAGHPTSKIMVYADGKPYQEVWLTTNLTMQADLDLKRLRELQAQLTQAIMGNIPNRQSVEEDPAYTQLLAQGYPIKIVELGEGGEAESVTEVLRIDKRDLAEREFQAPEEYRHIDLREFFREALEQLKKGE